MCIYCQPDGLPVYKEQENGIEVLFNELLSYNAHIQAIKCW